MTDQRAPSRSRAWSIVWRVGYRILGLLDPLLRLVWRTGWYPDVVDLRIRGRRSGRVRGTLVTSLVVQDRTYVGHPNGEAHWTRNLDAAGTAELVRCDGVRSTVRAERLPEGAERDAVIHATRWLQPFPANLVYRPARRHILAAGVYFRLEPARSAETDARP